MRIRGKFARLGLLATAILVLAVSFSSEASAQGCVNRCNPTPHENANPALSGQAALLDVGSQFLQRLGALSSFRTAASPANNPQGGGADAPVERYRAWLEGYGLTSRTGAQGDFSGDRRRTNGVVAGAGTTIVPGMTVGLSVDRSSTNGGCPVFC